MSYDPGRPLTRRDFLSNVTRVGAAGAAACAGARLARATADARPPNVILILADDLGYDDLGVQGARDLLTPNIDSIAKNGVRFTDGYVPCPVCGPTRAGLLTGRYPQSFGFEFNNVRRPTSADAEYGLPLKQKTLANHLRHAGYKTGIVGKWHLGDSLRYRPYHRGFDEFFGFIRGRRGYYDDPHEPLFDMDTKVSEREYLTDAFGRKAVSFIERHRSDPFFLYLPFNAVHSPPDPPPKKYTDRFPHISDRVRKNFAGMLAALDDAVGHALRAVRVRGLSEETIIIFMSDNGGTQLAGVNPQRTVQGGKGWLYEGGIRVPMMMKWPKRIAPGTLYRNPVSALDVVPTMLAAAGLAPVAGCDGVDLLPFLDGTNTALPHETLYWKYGGSSAIRKGDWKLHFPFTNAPASLINLAQDKMEEHDLAAQEPARVAELSRMLNDFKSLLPHPLWTPKPVPRSDNPAVE